MPKPFLFTEPEVIKAVTSRLPYLGYLPTQVTILETLVRWVDR